jgi:hypothetical protein
MASLYVPGNTSISSPFEAALTAYWILVKSDGRPSLATVMVAPPAA